MILVTHRGSFVTVIFFHRFSMRIHHSTTLPSPRSLFYNISLLSHVCQIICHLIPFSSILPGLTTNTASCTKGCGCAYVLVTHSLKGVLRTLQSKVQLSVLEVVGDHGECRFYQVFQRPTEDGDCLLVRNIGERWNVIRNKTMLCDRCTINGSAFNGGM